MSGAGPSGQAAPALGVNLEKHPSGIVPMLQNVVATVNLGCKLDLKEIALHARNAEYNPKRFAAVIMRIREPKTTALIFASGKMVCTGAKSEEDARTAARKYAKIVQKLGFPATFKEFKVQNMVGSTDVRFPIRLEGLAFGHTLFASYEPELFPGLIYRMKMPKVVLLIFVSGKVVLTGAKFRDDIYTAFENIYPILQSFRKGDAANPLPAPIVAPPPVPALMDSATHAQQQQQQMQQQQQQFQQQQYQQFQQQQGGAGPSRVPRLPPPTPSHMPNLPPPTPTHAQHFHNLPPPTPQHMPNLPPPTPHHAPNFPPPTPMHQFNNLPPPTPQHHPNFPPPTPVHAPNLPPPTPVHQSNFPPPTPVHQPNLPPPTPYNQ